MTVWSLLCPKRRSAAFLQHFWFFIHLSRLLWRNICLLSDYVNTCNHLKAYLKMLSVFFLSMTRMNYSFIPGCFDHVKVCPVHCRFRLLLIWNGKIQRFDVGWFFGSFICLFLMWLFPAELHAAREGTTEIWWDFCMHTGGSWCWVWSWFPCYPLELALLVQVQST